ncbi:DUF1611 domain-containing protein [Cronbergia sp. UHCC 0137]|uniref:DUF1611 domain-containing protein n=1 Tax=Cronbergia sp. UHCC 0137 TaxID=3110239 RepID=UPI002B21180D|nr:DUF1611 domain-containing protein [Cronbergia sp. UHCC 0137]MEA5618515.1 DUF1611 domain-containing protein [Cronbergia sp. UHCC 0137]
MRLALNQRIAVLLHEGLDGTGGKTGLSILRYSESPIVAVIDRESSGKSLLELTGIKRDVPIVASVASALHFQPEVLVIGIAPKGGAIPDDYWIEIKDALKAGMSIVNGLHTPLANIPELNALLKPGQLIWDVRKEPGNLDIASGIARTLPCRRILTVGTDMAIGKMSTSLELHWAAKLRGWRSKFLATGQTGLMLEGDGVALDAVRVDFAAGAVEQIVMRFGKNYDILQIEGQGSLLHPGSTATLPLIRGSQPTQMILVHKAGQTHIKNCPQVEIPPLPEVIKLYETVASAGGAFGTVPVVGVALNTKDLDEIAAKEAIAQTINQTGLPCTDPVRFGAGVLLDAVMSRS